MSALPTFRVHFEDGEIIRVSAASPDAARKQALQRHDGIVTKVMRVREQADA